MTFDFQSFIGYCMASFFVGFFIRKIFKTVARLMSGSYFDG
ncbi:hypothetical protein ACFPAG_09140 [Vogesella sp. GCM10023246]|uniref:Uncharacterized protein n=1 Tax=Vogesella oryzagri TaxID=3160864 RepID=A0ABV1M3G5_9NEIS